MTESDHQHKIKVMQGRQLAHIRAQEHQASEAHAPNTKVKPHKPKKK